MRPPDEDAGALEDGVSHAGTWGSLSLNFGMESPKSERLEWFSEL